MPYPRGRRCAGRGRAAHWRLPSKEGLGLSICITCVREDPAPPGDHCPACGAPLVAAGADEGRRGLLLVAVRAAAAHPEGHGVQDALRAARSGGCPETAVLRALAMGNADRGPAAGRPPT